MQDTLIAIQTMLVLAVLSTFQFLVLAALSLIPTVKMPSKAPFIAHSTQRLL
jgi:hypothetical protein